MRKCVGCEEQGLPLADNFYICYDCAVRLGTAMQSEIDEDMRKLAEKLKLPPVCPICCATSTRAGLTRDGEICEGCRYMQVFA